MRNGKIRLSRKWVNPIYWEIDKYAKEPKVTEILIFGGKGSAKSFSVCQYIGLKSETRGKSALIFRKETSRVKTTIKKTMRAAIESMRIIKDYDKLDFKFRSTLNESEMVLGGLDNEEKAKGVEGFDYVLLDEINQFTYEEYEQVSLSHRGKKEQILFGTWNPISENIWVKKKLIDVEEWDVVDHTLPSPDSYIHVSKDGSRVLIKTDYRDNYWAVGSPCGSYGFIDNKLIAKYQKLKKTNPRSYNINVLGNWGVDENEDPWFDTFQERNIVSGLEVIKNIPLSLGFDFNKGRMACTIGQKIPQWGINILDCIDGILIKDTCEKTLRRYGDHEMGFKVFGDASGKSGNAMTGSYNYFSELQKHLKVSNSAFNVLHSRNKNMEHSQSRVLISSIMYDIPTFFDKKKCALLIEEVRKAEVIENPKTNKQNLRKDDGLFKMDRVDSCRYLLENMLPYIKSQSTINIRRNTNNVEDFRKIIEAHNPDVLVEYDDKYR